ncbi:MAG: glycosyltransferase family 4 protein [Spirochaetota bacterium]
MKIVLVSFQNARSDRNGVACHIRDTLAVFTRKQKNISLVTPYEWNTLPDKFLRKLSKALFWLYEKTSWELFFFYHLNSIILHLKNNCKRIETEETIYHAHDIISLIALHRLKTHRKVIFTAHFLVEPWREFSQANLLQVGGLYYKKIESMARDSLLMPQLQIITVSERNRNLLAKMLPEKDIFSVVYLGLDLQWNSEHLEYSQPKQPYVLNVGKISNVKNQIALIPIAKHLKAQNRQVLFLLVGPIDTIEKSRIDSLIIQEGVENYFQFAGTVNRDTTYYLMQHSLLYLHTAKMESFGMAIVEACGFSPPVLVFENDVIYEIFQEDREGIIAENFSATEKADLLISYLDSTEKRVSLSDKQTVLFTSKYTIEKMYKSLVGIYEH